MSRFRARHPTLWVHKNSNVNDIIEGTEVNFSGSKLKRTPLLLLDYIQFLAARSIQRHWRGFHSRLMWARRTKAAITIQSAWRGYRDRRNFFDKIEGKTQDTLIRHYNVSATKIQALFRGWRTRQRLHDEYGLRKAQNFAAADLLSCVATKLHYLLRTYQIPGVYSLRNTQCLSRVEKLLVTTRYKFFNWRMVKEMERQQRRNERLRKDFSSSTIKAPFKGPNVSVACKPQVIEELARTKNVEKRMYKIISEYDKSIAEAKAALKQPKNKADKRHRARIHQITQRVAAKSDFCGDVISSMRRWNILKDNGCMVDRNMFSNPKKLERFLDDCFEIVEEMKLNCHCKMPAYDIVICH